METARVELRKLQLLNDRINQCLDALNQVRLSVHGLSHTTAPGNTIGSQAQIPGIPGIAGAADPRLAFGMAPFAAQAQGGGYFGGLSHTPFQPIQQFGGFAPGIGQGGVPQNFQGLPMWNPVAGLSHTGAELDLLYSRPLWADPVQAARVKETFPFVNYALPPVVSIY